MKHIVVFASGSGTNFQAIIDAVNNGYIQAKITGLITDRPGIGAIERAEANNIPVEIIPPSSSTPYLQRKLELLDPDLMVLAGYLQKIPPEIVDQYPRKIINIHPSLLPNYGGPGFYGNRVHQEVLKNQEIESGCTVHYVTKEYDKGPIIAQRKVKVHPQDTPEDLAKRILKQEHQLLPGVVKQILNN